MRRKPFLSVCILLLAFVLLACQAIESPDNPISDNKSLVSPEIVEPTASSTPDNTPTKTATATKEVTATPEATATPEKTEEEKMNEYCIKRAKEVGIDLENFANSNNLWVTEHQGLAGLEGGFNTSFTDDRTFKTMIVVGYDSLNSQSRYDKAQTTAEGNKIMAWYEVIYKKADGNYQMVLLPREIWDIESKIMWDKSALFGGPRFNNEINSEIMFNVLIKNASYPDFLNYNPDWDNFTYYTTTYLVQGFWLGPGAFINFDSDYPSLTAGGAGTIEEPSFTVEEHAQFQQTGKADFLPYHIVDPDTGLKLAYLYPFVNYATSSVPSDYVNQTMKEDIVDWYYVDKQAVNPSGSPYPRHWEKIP